MKFRGLIGLIFAMLAGCALLTAQTRPAGVTSPPMAFTTGSSGPLIQDCFGYSSAIVFADNSGSLSATLTTTTSPDVNPQSFGTPYSSVPPGSTTQTTTLTSFPGTLIVTLGSARFVRVAISGYASGSSNVIISCSNAVARGPGGNGTGSLSNVGASAPITSTVIDPTTVRIGCAALPLSCGVVVSGNSYGMVPDSCTTDNGIKLTAAYAAANALGPGAILLVPYASGSVYGFSTPVSFAGSNVTLMGYGPGAGLGTGHFPTRINGGTIFKACTNLGGAPLLSLAPTSATEQAGNAVIGIQFDGNSNGTSADLGTTGLYITGQFMPYTDRLSFVHFSGPAIHWQGSQIGGSAKGSVIIPHIGDIEISQPNAWDGPCLTIDALAVGGVDWGDVFGGDPAGAIHCTAWNWPGVIVGRSDHLNLPFIQVNAPPGAPTPTPNPTGSPAPTPFPQLANVCGAVQNHYGAMVMAQFGQYRAESTNAASPEPSCAPPENDPKGTTFAALQTYGNSALPPGNAVGNVTYFDDNGDLWLTPSSTIAPFICFSQGSQTGGASGCPGTGIQADASGNLNLGINGNNITGFGIEFAAGGNGSGAIPNQYQSFIDSVGALAFGTIGSETSSYGATGSNNIRLLMTSTAVSGDAFTFNNTGASGAASMFDVQNNGVTKFEVSGSGNVGVFNNLNLLATGSNTITSATTSGVAFIMNDTGASSGFMLSLQNNGTTEFTVSGSGAGTFTGKIAANGGSQVTPFIATGTCTMTGQSSCTATTALPGSGSQCNAGFTSDPNVDTLHTLSLWTTKSGTTLTTHVEVAQGTTTTNTPTWNVNCL